VTLQNSTNTPRPKRFRLHSFHCFLFLTRSARHKQVTTLNPVHGNEKGVASITMAQCYGGESCCETKSPSRMRGRGWLSGLGMRSSSGPSLQTTSAQNLSPRPRRASAIADDIRNDHNLFFLDDEIIPPASPGTTTVGPKIDHCLGGSSSAINTGLRRRSSLEKMECLQREVDYALEFFHQETENELDGDEYFKQYTDKYPPTYTDHRCHEYGGYGDEYDESLPETDATSNSTSVATNHDNAPMSDANISSALSAGPRGLSIQHKTKSILSLPLSLIQSQPALNSFGTEDDTLSVFHNVVADELSRIRGTVEQKYRGAEFNTSIPLRSAMEPFLAAARACRLCSLFVLSTISTGLLTIVCPCSSFSSSIQGWEEKRQGRVSSIYSQQS
jgi:hypothetical protein